MIRGKIGDHEKFRAGVEAEIKRATANRPHNILYTLAPLSSKSEFEDYPVLEEPLKPIAENLMVYNQGKESSETNPVGEENLEMNSETYNNLEKLMDEKINNIDRRLSESQQHMTKLLDVKIDALGAKVDAIDTKLDSKLEARLNGIEKSLDATVDGIAKKLDARIEDIKDSTKEVNDQLRHVRNQNIYIFYASMGIVIAVFLAIFFKA